MIAEALGVGKDVVIDNTNPTPAVRGPLIEIGRAHGARVAAYYFEVPVKTAVARNRQREGKARVPDVLGDEESGWAMPCAPADRSERGRAGLRQDATPR